MTSVETMPVRLVVVDDHEVARNRLVARLARQSRVQVVGEVADHAAALELTKTLRPDAVLIETRRLDQKGIEAIAMFSRLAPDERPAVIAYLEIVHRADWQDARAVGADDVILKEMTAESLAEELLRIVSAFRQRALNQGSSLA